MDNMKFSVSMCVYGGDNAAHFDLALESVFNQSLAPDEVVLVVDGPVNDEINGVIQKYELQFDFFKVVRLEKNSGLGIARKVAMSECSYDLVILMDADDLCVPGRFEKQIQAFRDRPDLSIVGGQIEEFIGDENNIVGKRVVPENDEEIKEYMKRRCPLNHVTVAFRLSDVLKAGSYIDWYYNEDYYLWIRMAQAGMKFCNLPDTLVKVRVGNEMYQRRGGLKYFKSEEGIQRYMLKSGIINLSRYFKNVAVRFILQVLLPNWLRGWVFKKFARD